MAKGRKTGHKQSASENQPEATPHSRSQKVKSAVPPASTNIASIPTDTPQFAQPEPTPDPTKFTVAHGSDTAAYSILDKERGHLPPRPFPVVHGTVEPTLTLAEALEGPDNSAAGGESGDAIVAKIEKTGRIVFHCLGDTGSTRGPKSQDEVTDKMVADYSEPDPEFVPSFLYHLGDVVYSFGESQYYYDQFYDPYRDYPAPIFAIPGNHDGMVSPLTSVPSLKAFLENFCTAGQPPHRTPEAGGLVRTAGVQPGVYFTLEAPFVRILGLYSNCLEDPGIISAQGNQYPYLGNAQLDFLTAALERVKKENPPGALLIAVHHPPYVAQTKSTSNKGGAKHGGSPAMLAEIDKICAAADVWPHAVLSGHAHNYQRFTRTKNGMQIPFIVAGNGGHAITRLTKKDQPTLRTPMAQPSLSEDGDTVTFESYDDGDYGYLRIIVDAQQLRIEYHPAADGPDAKTPDDSVTVDLASRKLVHYVPTA